MFCAIIVSNLTWVLNLWLLLIIEGAAWICAIVELLYLDEFRLYILILAMQYIIQEVFSFLSLILFAYIRVILQKMQTVHSMSLFILDQADHPNFLNHSNRRWTEPLLHVYNKKNVRKEDGLAYLKCKAVCNEPNSAIKCDGGIITSYVSAK